MKIFLQVLELVPAIIALVKAVESQFPESGKGAVKLAMVRSILEAAHDNITDMWPSIEKIIAVLVKFFNENGSFNK